MSRAAASGPVPFTVPLVGGLDLVTNPLQMPAGRAIAAVNYEPLSNGYGRIDGIERLDGHTKPSEASYSLINFDNGTAAITAGQSVTGDVSGATAVVLADAVVQNGTYGGGNAVGYVAIGAITGTFQVTEHLQVAAVSKVRTTSLAVDRGATDDDLDAQYLATAIVNARNLIQPVPGAGPVRGAALCKRDGNIYAWRDDLLVAPTKSRMYRATAAGWVLVALGWSLKFTASGATAIVAGNTVTGGTSGATGLVSKVITDGNQTFIAALTGVLILSATTGTFQAGEDLKVGGVTLATTPGPATANVIAPGGRFECINTNFYGATSQGALYAAYGKGPAFEFDGTIFSPILTGAATETPQHIAAHKNHLFLTYPNGGLTGSQSGLPLCYNGTFGATAFGMGDDIVGLMPELAGVLAIFCKSLIRVLSGSIAADFVLEPFTTDVGAKEWTVETMGGPVFMDQGGVRDLTTTQALGNFKVGTKTQMVQPLIDAKKKARITPVACLRVRDKAHYRLYFSDGTGISIFIGGKQPSILPFDYGARIPRCMFSSVGPNDGEDETEILLMGCDDGYVYQIDKGTSMDGANIDAFLRPAFNHCGSPGYNKRTHRMSVTVSGARKATLFMTGAFSDGDPDQPAITEQSFTVLGGGAFWNEANWNQFIWSSRVNGKATADIDGLGNNFSPTIGTSAMDEEPHILSTYTLIHSLKGPVKAP
jgi:hypothetical protein